MPEDFVSKHVALIIQYQEKDKYTAYNVEKFVLPSRLDNMGLAETRQFVLENFPEDKIVFFDDDISILKKVYIDGKPKYVKMEKDDWNVFFQVLDETLSEVIHCGICFESIGIRTNQLIVNSRYMTVLGLNRIKVLETNSKFNIYPFSSAEDVDMNLQLLTKGYPNRILTDYAISSKSWWSEGGCSAYRTQESHKKCLEELHNRFPEFLTIYTDKKGQIKERVQWKKAFDSSKIKIRTLF